MLTIRKHLSQAMVLLLAGLFFGSCTNPIATGLNGAFLSTGERTFSTAGAGKVATPRLSPPKGISEDPLSVTVTCATVGAVIRYTIDGSRPGPESPEYTAPIPVPEGTVRLIQAVAYKEGLSTSSRALGWYAVKRAVSGGEILFVTNRDTAVWEADWWPERYERRVDSLYVMSGTGVNQTGVAGGAPYYEYPGTFIEYHEKSDWSPDRTRIVTVRFLPVDNTNELIVIDRRGSELLHLTEIVENGLWQPDWSPDGTAIVFSNQDSILEVDSSTPNGARREIVGSDDYGPDRIHDFVAFPSWSPDMRRIVFSSAGVLWLVKRDGSGLTRIPGQTTENSDPNWHPVKNLIAYAGLVNGQWDIFVVKPDGTGAINLTNSPGDDRQPDWSPDGKRIAFASMRDGNWEIYSMNADGTDQRNLTNNPARDVYPSW